MPGALRQFQRLFACDQLRQWTRSVTRCVMPAALLMLVLQRQVAGFGSASVVQEASEAGALPARAEVTETIDRVLSGDEFLWKEESYISSLIRQAKEKFFELLGSALESLFGLGIDSVLIARVIIFILAAVLLLLAIKLIILYLDRRRRGELPAEQDWVSTQPALQTPSALLDAARHSAAEGRFEEAMHQLYQGVILWLDERELAGYEAGKTGGEYAREIKSAEAKNSFKELLRAFYPVAFGGRSASSEKWASMQSAADKIGALE